ncbi:TetR family transcriptional regulator [Aureimonas altamirensis]|uniref:TetR/AcrR family transcriptional regulator n=1 Tax=Aureimonas altamirensis TaxID=370622 RepID=UPI00255568F6|nr:TetR family transcriptional regulator [Aureimonas altamirensis]
MARDAQATRERLIAAARMMFSRQGFERTTVREIAGEAGVNPALINRYFGGKEQLFAEAVSIDLDFPDLSRVKRDRVGRTLVAHFFARWEGSDENDLLRVLIRTAATNGEAAARIRAILTEQVTAMVADVAGPDRARERACLIATQILGLAYARNVLGLSNEDVAPETALGMIGDTIQRYLLADLP